MIKIKNSLVLRELLISRYHPILIELILWVLQRYDGIVITSGYRDGDKGVHGTESCRGIDIRSWGLKKKDGSDTNAGVLCTEINTTWKYDPKRPDKLCAVYHNSGSGLHIHLQVHKNTTMNGAQDK